MGVFYSHLKCTNSHVFQFFKPELYSIQEWVFPLHLLTFWCLILCPPPPGPARFLLLRGSKTRGIGVFDPHLDLREAGDPERLERHHALPEESSGIYFRSSRPLPQEKMGLAQVLAGGGGENH